MWYRQGSITVTNGQPVVTGAGTDFVSNASVGDAFIGPDGRSYEIAQIISATDLRLATGYQAATGGGQAYAIQPTQSFIRDLALQAGVLLNTFAAVRDGIGQGLIQDGSIAAPALRFIADQDTGLTRYGTNLLSAVTGGVERMRFGETNSSISPLVAGGGAICQQGGAAGTMVLPLDVYGALGGAATMRIRFGSAANAFASHSFIEAQTLTSVASDLRFGSSGVERGRFDYAGNLNIGCSGFPHHAFETDRSVAGTPINSWRQPGVTVAAVYAVDFGGVEGASSASAAFKVGRAATGRSINSSGTINANGADYAEYMRKAAGCGTIAKGDVCGVDRDGLLTDRWSDSISFMVKSTDPSVVGGDTWASHLHARPAAPGAEPQPPVLPAVPGEGADEAAIEAYRDSLAAYPSQIAQYRQDHAAWGDATAAYQRDFPAWETELEAARVRVDRIAYCGQVPVNLTGSAEVGDYLVAAQDGDRIMVVAVADTAITFDQYRRRVGKVLAIRDGRPWVNVQHG